MPAWKLAALSALVALAGCAPAGPQVVVIRSAARIDVTPADPAATSAAPSSAQFAQAPQVPLPDLWLAARRSQWRDAWYRATVELAEAPRGDFVVYLPRLAMNAAVAVNGEGIGDGGPFHPVLARNSYRPLLFPVPSGLLHVGRNSVDVRLAVDPTVLGLLGPILVGPASALRPAFERQMLWQITLVELAIILNFCFGLAAIRITMGRYRLPGYAWTAVGCLLWAVAMLELVVRDPPLPALLWHWLSTAALAGTVPCLVIGAHRFLELGRPRFERAVVALWLAGAVAFAAALVHGSPPLVDAVVFGWALATLVVCGYLVWLLFLVWQSSPSRSVSFAAPLGVVGLLAAAHDISIGLGRPVWPSFFILPLLGSVVAVWGGIRLLERFGQALAESEQLNRDLEKRVDERGREITRNYERIGGLERERAVERERQRLMGDIHDGLGSQLSSTLALVESESVSRDEVADALRDALDDMRLLIASLAPDDDDVIGLLARWRGRIERRLERRELRFDWQVTELPTLPWLGPRESLSVLRIFQEAVSNVVQHASAATITVRTGVGDGDDGSAGVWIEIRDDGDGVAATSAAAAGGQGARVARWSEAGVSTSEGFGIQNMKRRAAELGGALVVRDGCPGTSVVLWLPLVRAGGLDREVG